MPGRRVPLRALHVVRVSRDAARHRARGGRLGHERPGRPDLGARERAGRPHPGRGRGAAGHGAGGKGAGLAAAHVAAGGAHRRADRRLGPAGRRPAEDGQLRHGPDRRARRAGRLRGGGAGAGRPGRRGHPVGRPGLPGRARPEAAGGLLLRGAHGLRRPRHRDRHTAGTAGRAVRERRPRHHHGPALRGGRRAQGAQRRRLADADRSGPARASPTPRRAPRRRVRRRARPSRAGRVLGRAAGGVRRVAGTGLGARSRRGRRARTRLLAQPRGPGRHRHRARRGVPAARALHGLARRRPVRRGADRRHGGRPEHRRRLARAGPRRPARRPHPGAGARAVAGPEDHRAVGAAPARARPRVGVIVQSVDWLALRPALAPALAALLVLTLDAVLGRRRPGVRTLLDVVAALGVVAGLAALLPLGSRTRETFCWPDGGCAYEVSRLTLALQAIVLVSALVCLLLAMGARARPAGGEQDDVEEGGSRPELLLLMLTATAGACALAGTRELASLAVALETASLPVVGLVALRRDGRGAEASLKLLLTSVLVFGLLVLCAALVYASSGSLRLGAPVADRLGDLGAVHGVGLALVVAGAAFKLSLVPFHLWTPETYTGAPLPVAAFLATTSKVAGLGAVVLVLAVGAPDQAAAWAPPMGVLAAVTMTVGNLVALRQQSVVRLLAWSTVAQAGWVVLPLGGAVGGGVNGAVSASVAYLLAYAVASLAAFAVVVRVARTHPDGARHRLDAYAGLWRRDPVLALVLAFALLCLAGLPPGVMGLVAKVVALVPVVGAQAWGLAAAAVVNAVLGIAVYLRWAAHLAGPADSGAESVAASGTAVAAEVGVNRAVQPRTQRLALALAAAGCL